MNAKSKGSRNERRARRMLEANGYNVVRAAGSLGAFDLVAVSRRGVRLVQVKSNRGPRRAERERMAVLDNPPRNVTREVWMFHDLQREPKIEVVP